MPSFKTDESFLEKIAIGAIGTRKVFENLQLLGHKPIELERGSLNYKIWKKIKIKRIRVPDILCIDCGIRVESRAKTNFEISMSHSIVDIERGWDAGMRDEDYVAIVVCEKRGIEPIDWHADDLIQYISVRDLKTTHSNKQVLFTRPKGFEEGSEVRIQWPTMFANYDGVIKDISEERIQYNRINDNRTISLSLAKKGLKLTPLININEKIKKNQVLAATVNVIREFPFETVDRTFFVNKLNSTSLSERYGASKALGYFNIDDIYDKLISKLGDEEEHIYVKLEIAATLARNNIANGYKFILECLNNEYLQNVLESIIVLAEIKTNESCGLLCNVLKDKEENTEIRAGAAWALGEINNKEALETLMSIFEDIPESIKIESARALAKLSNNYTENILSGFRIANESQRPGIAWALSKSNSLKIDELLKELGSKDLRHWVSYIIGFQGREKFINDIEKIKSSDVNVYFATTLLWKILTNWVFNLKEY